MKTDPLIRLLRKCEWRGECLVWTGTTVRGLYGTFQPHSTQKSSKAYVHRYSYTRFVGPIPPGTEIDHVKARGCTSSLCVLPWHLEAVTHVENQRRMRLTVCRAGKHDLTDPANVKIDKQGRRRGCAACGRERALARYYETRGNSHGSLQLPKDTHAGHPARTAEDGHATARPEGPGDASGPAARGNSRHADVRPRRR